MSKRSLWKRAWRVVAGTILVLAGGAVVHAQDDAAAAAPPTEPAVAAAPEPAPVPEAAPAPAAELVPVPEAAAVPAPVPAGPLGDSKSVEAYLDGVINTVMQERQIPGAIMVIVQNGSVFLSKGYGYADIEKKSPVQPDRTLFRIASVSKMINATAVMQLVEQGKLDLNADVNELLQKFDAPLTIPQHYSEPIRLLDLIDHTAGFDERAIGMASLDKNKVPALGDYLTRRMPPQMMPPRTTISYSNHGVGLSGLLVQLAADAPYDAYVREHIFAPLGMNHSSFELTDALAPDMAQGYAVKGGRVTPVPFDYINIPPAGGMVSCADDMAKFMIAHLQKGRLGDARILQESTADEMHRVQYKQDPRLDGGIAVGFFTGTRNGHRYIEHGGDLNGFASELWLLPDDGIGFFTSCTVDDGKLRVAITRAFMDRYFPAPALPEPRPNPELAKDAEKYAGYYRPNRYARGSIEKLTTLMNQCRVNYDDGGLTLTGIDADPVRFVEEQPGVFLNARSGVRMVYRTDGAGKVTHLLMNGGAMEKLPWYEEARWHVLFVVAVILILGCAVVVWPLAWVFRRPKANGPVMAPSHYRAIAWLFSAMSLGLLLNFGYTMANLDQWEFTYGMPERIILLLCIPPVLCLGAVLLVFYGLSAWWHGYWSGLARIDYTLVVAACAALIPFFVYWNLLGFNC